jgi:hypothetical protein
LRGFVNIGNKFSGELAHKQLCRHFRSLVCNSALLTSKLSLFPPSTESVARTYRDDLPKAGLANITATMFSLLGLEAPSFYEPSLVK